MIVTIRLFTVSTFYTNLQTYLFYSKFYNYTYYLVKLVLILKVVL
jgi:hypothetical protein